MKLFRDLGRLVESGIFFSFEARVELPHVKHWANSSSIYSTTAWFASSRKHSGSATLRAPQTCIAAGQNPLGPGREWEATSASSYTSFSAKGKAKSARCARCSNVEFVFTSRDYKRLQNKTILAITSTHDQSSSGGDFHGPQSISSFAATASTTSSSHGRPTICTPIGKPSSESPIGTTAAGKPGRLNHPQE